MLSDSYKICLKQVFNACEEKLRETKEIIKKEPLGIRDEIKYDERKKSLEMLLDIIEYNMIQTAIEDEIDVKSRVKDVQNQIDQNN